MAVRPRTVDVPLSEVALSVQIPVVDDGLSAFSGAWTRRDILDRFERGELRLAPDTDREMEETREAAHNTLKKTRRVNLRVTERDYMLIRARAREEVNSLPADAVEHHPQVRVRAVEREQWMNRVAGRDQPWKTYSKLVGQFTETQQGDL